MNNRDNLIGIFQTMYRWRKAIRNICLIALIGSIAFSLTLDNYYQASTIFYPASPELANPELIFGYTSQVTDYFGSDRDLDRIAEIANSAEVVDFMVSRFKLYEVYGLDSTSLKGRAKVREYFRNVYVAQKNKNDAIELSVEDTDPQRAAEMANAAREKINEIAQRLIKNSQSRIIATFEENIKNKAAELEVLGDSLRRLQAQYDIYGGTEQGEQLSAQLATAESEIVRNRARLEVLEGNPLIPRDTIEYIKANLRAFERERENLMTPDAKDGGISVKEFNEGLPKVTVITDLHFQARKQLSFDLERYNQIRAAFNTDIPAVQVIETATPPLLKSRPKRSILVIASVAAAFLFAVLGVLLAEAYRDFNWKEIKMG
ncbi:MAG: Wzz/FepE/Etk N-terminal domain-containing protein [Saprospiraceae bacterium]